MVPIEIERILRIGNDNRRKRFVVHEFSFLLLLFFRYIRFTIVVPDLRIVHPVVMMGEKRHYRILFPQVLPSKY